MKVIYYTKPCFLDLALSHARELGRLIELHLIIDVAPESWQSSLFDIPMQYLKPGVMDCYGLFRKNFPSTIQKYLANCASMHIVVHNCSKSIHPATWRICYQAIKFCKRINPDIIHFDEVSLRTAWGQWLLKNIPTVFAIHDPIPHSGESNWRADLARKLSFSFVDRFILYSASMKDSFVNDNNLQSYKVCLSQLGVYTIYREWIKSAVQDDGKTVLFFGRLSPYKGLDVLYKSVLLVAEKIPGVRFVIAGRPIGGYKLPAIPNLSGGTQVEVINSYISNERLAELFQRATIVVCPYLDATQSGVILTAYAFKKPVIATNTGGLPEYVLHEKSGVLIEPGNHVQLSEAIAKLLGDSEYLQQLQAGVEAVTATELNWERIAQQTHSIYSKLLEEKHPGSHPPCANAGETL